MPEGQVAAGGDENPSFPVPAAALRGRGDGASEAALRRGLLSEPETGQQVGRVQDSVRQVRTRHADLLEALAGHEAERGG